MAQTAVMHDDRIPVPEIDGGQVAGENLLGLDVVHATAGLVGDLCRIVEQGVEVRTRVVGAVSAFGGKI